jgi:transposase
MKRIPRANYTAEYREQAVKLCLVDKLTIPEAAKRLAMPAGTLKAWVHAARKGTLGAIGTASPVPHKSEWELEIARLKRELIETQMERDLLKNVRPTS